MPVSLKVHVSLKTFSFLSISWSLPVSVSNIAFKVKGYHCLRWHCLFHAVLHLLRLAATLTEPMSPLKINKETSVPKNIYL